jgi:peptidoglycan/LPS O-acetylase OafA/YrhL
MVFLSQIQMVFALLLLLNIAQGASKDSLFPGSYNPNDMRQGLSGLFKQRDTIKSLMSEPQAYNDEFTISYPKDPITCLIAFANITSQSNEDGLKAYLASGLFFNNLGDYNTCESIDGMRYVVLIYSGSPFVVITLCGPEVCTGDDYRYIYYLVPTVPPTYAYAVFPKDYQEEYYGTYSGAAILMLVFISAIAYTALLATYLDYYLKEENKDSIQVKFLLCFSIISNGQKLLTSRAQERLGKKDSLEMLNSVRVMSIGWVILGHTCLNYLSVPVLSNFTNYLDEITKPNYILAYTAFYAVDSFFWLSGLLMSYLFIIEVEKSMSVGKFIMVYIHRFLRITPVYMFVIFFFWSMQKYIGNGPLWIGVGDFNEDCDSYWYSNLIYMNDFIPDGNVSNCIGVSWYLSNDMQIFWIAPILMILYIKVDKIIGWISIGLLCVVNVLCAGLIAYHYGLNPVVFSTDNEDNYQYYYYKPYNRVAPYAIGLACGFIIYSYRKYQDSGEVYDKIGVAIGKLQENKTVRWLTFFFGLVLINTLIFSQYDAYKDSGPDSSFHNWSEHQNIAFIAFERVTFGLGLSMVFLPMLLGHFRGIAWFLSLYPWSVLARLTFAIYLIHYSIIQTVLRSQQNVLEFGIYYIIRDTIFFFILSAFFAIPIVLLIELPSSNIERLIFRKESKKKANKEIPGNEDLLGLGKTISKD